MTAILALALVLGLLVVAAVLRASRDVNHSRVTTTPPPPPSPEGRPWPVVSVESLKRVILELGTVVHTDGCSDEQCREQYGVDDPTFVCESCKRLVGYCMGCGDNHIELCDDCWAEQHRFDTEPVIQFTGATNNDGGAS